MSYLGIDPGTAGLVIAQRTLNNFVEWSISLYNQRPGGTFRFHPARGIRKGMKKIGGSGSRERGPLHHPGTNQAGERDDLNPMI